jgi:hypothetical protein
MRKAREETWLQFEIRKDEAHDICSLWLTVEEAFMAKIYLQSIQNWGQGLDMGG